MKALFTSLQHQRHTIPAAREALQRKQRSNDGADVDEHQAVSIAQTKWQQVIDASPRMLAQRKQVEGLFGNPNQREEQNKTQSVHGVGGPAFQPCNSISMPDHIKDGVESPLELVMDDVRVHDNSTLPAQLQALAYAKGTEIHLGTDQENHLPHETWHAIQQKQGQITPTMQAQEVTLNDHIALESEADVTGEKTAAREGSKSVKADSIYSHALSMPSQGAVQLKLEVEPTKLTKVPTSSDDIIQREEIVGTDHDDYYPTQDSVNRCIVENKQEAIRNERYDVSFSYRTPEEENATPLISDGHHAYVASRREGQDIESEESGVAASNLTWRDVTYSDDLNWYNEWLGDNFYVDHERLEALKNSLPDESGIESVVWELKEWEVTSILNSENAGDYNDIWEAALNEGTEETLRERLTEWVPETVEQEGEDLEEVEMRESEEGEQIDNLNIYFYHANYGLGSQVHGQMLNASVEVLDRHVSGYREVRVLSAQLPPEHQSFTALQPPLPVIGNTVWVPENSLPY